MSRKKSPKNSKKRKITEIKAEEEHSDFAIKFLGYSLGALIAEFMASETGLTAVVFESPGAKRLIENTRMQSIAAKDFRVLNYKSWPNTTWYRLYFP